MTSFFIDKTLRMCFYFDWQVVSILTYTEGFCSSVNLYPTTRLSRGFPDTIIKSSENFRAFFVSIPSSNSSSAFDTENKR